MAAIKIDRLIRSKRKTIALVVMRDGRLVVRAPLKTPLTLIEQFVTQKAAWIRAKQTQAYRYQHQTVPHTFTAGECFLYLGFAYPLEIGPPADPPLVLLPASPNAPSALGDPSCAALSPDAPPAPQRFVLSAAQQTRALALFTDWYRLQARSILSERIAHYAAIGGLAPTALRISSARTRWGSCSSSGSLSFTWRLVMAPLAAIDYVVVHELAHLAERNHARPFWQIVARILPNYRQQAAWLKTNGHLLTLE